MPSAPWQGPHVLASCGGGVRGLGGVPRGREPCPACVLGRPQGSSGSAPDLQRQLLRRFLYCPLREAARSRLHPPLHPLLAAPEPCQQRPRPAPRRTRWRSWNTISTRSTSIPTPPRCASLPPRRASRRRRRRNGLSSAWPSGGGQKACPPNAGLSQIREPAPPAASLALLNSACGSSPGFTQAVSMFQCRVECPVVGWPAI